MRLDVTEVKPFESYTGIARVRPDGRIYTSRHGRCVFTGASDHGNGRLGRVSDGTGPRCRWPTPGRAANISRPADWKGYHMTAPPKDILQRHDAWVENEEDYQRKLRLLQSLWREEQGLPARKYGNQLAWPAAKETLDNYLTKTIRKVVKEEVEGTKQRSKGYQSPRIYNNLLSSQPLCFNLFGELTEDLGLASQVLSDMSKGRVAQVTAIEFEWSPRRSDPRYTGDKTAFDVYVIYRNATGQCGFLGIEVKYHENLEKKEKNYYLAHHTRYDTIAAEMGCFHEEHLDTLRQAGQPKADGLQQLWRDHLLMGVWRKAGGFDEACFVLLYPAVNTTCEQATADYRHCLSDTRTFEAWTLEAFVACLRQRTEAKWVRLFYDRYLDLSRLPL